MKKIYVILFFLSFGLEVYTQCLPSFPPVDGTPQETIWVEDNGFLLKTQVNVTSVLSGVTFTYSIFYTIPPNVASGTDIIIKDVIPHPLIVETSTNYSFYQTLSATVLTYTVPPGNYVQGTYNFQINVHFPPGTTCDGAFIDNNSCMETIGNSGALMTSNPLCTGYLSVTPVAVRNPFCIRKDSPLPYTGTGTNIVYQGVVDGEIEYNLTISKPNPLHGSIYGQQNLSNIVVTDFFPQNAHYVSGSIGTFFNNCNAVITNIISPVNSNFVQFTISNLPIDIFEGTPIIIVSLRIHYPGNFFPLGTPPVQNCASYTATSCNFPFPLQNTVTSNTSCANVALGANAPAGLPGKAVYITNPVPGCNGFYRLSVTNSGTGPLDVCDILDNVPNNVVVTKIVFDTYQWYSTPIPFELFINGNGPVTPINNVWYNTSLISPLVVELRNFGSPTPLQQGKIYCFDIYFTVGPNAPNTTISNTMNITYPPSSTLLPSSSTVNFTIENYQPKVCAVKSVCNKLQSYLYGDIIRYRLRIQNIGSQDLTSAQVTDVLNSNLEYVPGFELYYSSLDGNISCGTYPNKPASATTWLVAPPVQTGPTGQTITWNLPPIGPNCDKFNYWYTCPVDGVPYYYIEFNVRVKQYALAGSVPNFFTVSGGSLLAPKVSNTEYITVNSVYGAQVEKLIRVGTGPWGKTAAATPGSLVTYRLKYKNTSNYPVKNIILVDMLPQNYGLNDDRMILNRTIPNNRGSQFELEYSTIVNTPSGTWPYIMVNQTFNSNSPSVLVNDDQKICLPELDFSPANCTPSNPVWSTAGSYRNVKFDFSLTPLKLEPGDELTCDYKVQLPLGTPYGKIAYNSFALRATGYYYINSVLQNVYPLPAESDLASLTSIGENMLCGFKYNDLNGNGVRDPGEPGLANWVIQLNGGTYTTTTDSYGNYCFSNLPGGTYTVSEVQQNCWHQTQPDNPATYTVTLEAGQSIGNLEFGNIQDVCVPPPPDMIAWWPLDGQGTLISNNLLDIAGNHNGTTPCALPVDVTGKVEGAVRFNRANQAVIRVPNDPFVDVGDGDFTIDAWIYPENLSSYDVSIFNRSQHRIILDNRVTNYFGYGTPAWMRPGITLFVNNEQWNPITNQWDIMRLGLALKDDVSNYWSPASEFLSVSTPIVRNQWQHIAVVISRTGVGTFYYNGTPIGTFTPIPGTFVDGANSPSILDIGHSSRLNCGSCAFANDYFNGLLDEIEIFTRALDISEIASIYNAGCEGKCKDSSALQYGQFHGTKFNDLNGNGVKDTGEPGLPNWVINLAGTSARTTTTDNNGNYSFLYLQPGTYTISEVPQNCWHQTAPALPGTYTIALSSGESYSNLNFGNQADVCVPPPAGMVAWWHLDESSGPVAHDIAGFSNNGTYFNGPLPVTGKVANGLSFDGIDDYVEVPNHAELNFGTTNFSIDAWIKTSGNSGTNTIVDKRFVDVTSSLLFEGYYFFLSDGKLALQLGDGGYTNYISNVFVADGNWHHVAVTVERNNPAGIRFYLDGICLATNNPLAHTGSLTNSNPLRLGLSNTFGSIYQGILDEVEIFNRVLTSTEITSIVMAGCAGKCKDTTQVGSINGMKFNDLNGNGVKDAGEPGLPNWTIMLNGGNAVTTDNAGNYSFLNLVPGTYTLSEVPQSCWTQTTPSFPGTHTVTLNSGQNMNNLDFGNKFDSCTSPPLGMVAWWHFDEGTGTIAHDIAGFPSDGDYVNTPLPILGKVAIALSFDGIDDYVEVPDHPDLNFDSTNFSIDAWIKTSDSIGTVSIVDKRYINPYVTLGYYFFLNNGHLGLQLADFVSTDYITNIFVADGNWHHVAVTVDRKSSTGIRFYLDGAYLANHSPLSRQGSISNGVLLRIGNDYFNTAIYQGILDELEIFHRVITPQEINLIVLAGCAGKCKGLGSINGMKFNDLDGDGIKDPGEPGMAGWTIMLQNGTSVITGTNGSYSFPNLFPGSYTVSEVLQSCWTQTAPVFPGTYTVTLAAGQSINNKDFGNKFALPNVPIITGPVSPIVNTTGNIYTTQSGMTGYIWTVSAGGTITGGAGTNAISVTWNTVGAQTVSVNFTTPNGCTAPSPTIFPVTVNSALPLQLTLQNLNVIDTRCYNASQTIIVAGPPPTYLSTFIVGEGGQATMIAGQNIVYYAGTKVVYGGYMNGYIASGGPWCGAKSASIMAVPQLEPEPYPVTEKSFFSIYPNPTTGGFFLEIKGMEETAGLKVEMYGMLGDRVFSASLQGQRRYDLTLEGKPVGVYFIRVVSGKLAGTEKIIKQ
jgi:uncharacterized repeat protein (TIGR01451 family)